MILETKDLDLSFLTNELELVLGIENALLDASSMRSFLGVSSLAQGNSFSIRFDPCSLYHHASTGATTPQTLLHICRGILLFQLAGEVWLVSKESALYCSYGQHKSVQYVIDIFQIVWKGPSKTVTVRPFFFTGVNIQFIWCAQKSFCNIATNIDNKCEIFKLLSSHFLY